MLLHVRLFVVRDNGVVLDWHVSARLGTKAWWDMGRGFGAGWTRYHDEIDLDARDADSRNTGVAVLTLKRLCESAFSTKGRPQLFQLHRPFLLPSFL